MDFVIKFLSFFYLSAFGYLDRNQMSNNPNIKTKEKYIALISIRVI